MVFWAFVLLLAPLGALYVAPASLWVAAGERLMPVGAATTIIDASDDGRAMQRVARLLQQADEAHPGRWKGGAGGTPSAKVAGNAFSAVSRSVLQVVEADQVDRFVGSPAYNLVVRLGWAGVVIVDCTQQCNEAVDRLRDVLLGASESRAAASHVHVEHVVLSGGLACPSDGDCHQALADEDDATEVVRVEKLIEHYGAEFDLVIRPSRLRIPIPVTALVECTSPAYECV